MTIYQYQLLRSTNKKIIPIIIVAILVIGVFASVNFYLTQDQAKEIELPRVAEKIDSQIQETKDDPKSESAITSNIESNQDNSNVFEKTDSSPETLGPSQIKEPSKSETSSSSKQESKQFTTQRAVIIDQLNDELPNLEFQGDATRILEDAGYQVDLYTTKEITVEFYKKLPSMNYNFILIRSHGGEGDPSEEYPTRLFTGEKYATDKYTLDQLSGQVGYGFPFYDEQLQEFQEKHENPYDHAYFTISSKMVKEGMKGTFPESTIIVGGCQSARSHDLMESLIRRGAGHVLGWDASIGSVDNDKAMIVFLEDIFVNKVTLYDAAAKINKEMTSSFEEDNILKLFDAA